MPLQSDTVARVHALLRALEGKRLLLAVSGGADSMVLLDAAASVLDRAQLTVATFDHGTGRAATKAAKLVAEAASDGGMQVVIGRDANAGATEAEWRRARLAFLRGAARASRSVVVTAHTQNDQLETIVMRALRGAGPRGLAGLHAASDIARPLLDVSRAAIEVYARERGIIFVTDPSNSDNKHLRNRVRLELLPAILRIRPEFGNEMLALGRRAADWRARMEVIALNFPMVTNRDSSHSFELAPLRPLSEPSLRTLWPSLAARAGVVLDWRGTARLAAFTIEGANGGRIQLAGGHEVCLRDGSLVIRAGCLRG